MGLDTSSDTLVFDGSRVAEYDSALAKRLKSILQLAVERKASGTGCLARPEADIGLIELMCILHHLEPNAGWARKVAITYVHLLDSILRRVSDISWRFEWVEPVREDPLVVPEGEGKKATAAERTNLLSLYRESTDDIDEFAQVRAELLLRHADVKKLIGPPGSVSFREDDFLGYTVPPLPGTFPAPCWNHERAPDWPIKAKAFRERISSGLLCSLTDVLGDTAWVAYIRRKVWSDPAFAPGAQRDPAGRDTWLRFISFNRSYTTSVVGVEFYDRIFGVPDSGQALLAACLALSRVQHAVNVWTNRTAWMEWYFTPLLVGNGPHLEYWAQHVPDKKTTTKAGYCLCKLIEAVIKDEQVPLDEFVAGAKGKADQALAACLVGLHRRDASGVNEGVEALLKTYARADWHAWVGSRSIDLCVPAIAIQREALRRGLDISIPKAKNNDEELVRLPDPEEPSLPFCAYPGVAQVCHHDDLAWPSLFFDTPIRRFA